MEQQQSNMLCAPSLEGGSNARPEPVMQDGGPVCLWCEQIITTEPAQIHTDLGGTIEAQDLLVHDECSAEIRATYAEHATPRWGTIQ